MKYLNAAKTWEYSTLSVTWNRFQLLNATVDLQHCCCRHKQCPWPATEKCSSHGCQVYSCREARFNKKTRQNQLQKNNPKKPPTFRQQCKMLVWKTGLTPNTFSNSDPEKIRFHRFFHSLSWSRGQKTQVNQAIFLSDRFWSRSLGYRSQKQGFRKEEVKCGTPSSRMHTAFQYFSVYRSVDIQSQFQRLFHTLSAQGTDSTAFIKHIWSLYCFQILKREVTVITQLSCLNGSAKASRFSSQSLTSE